VSHLQKFLPRCRTAVMAGLLLPGLAFLVGGRTPATATTPAPTQNFVLGYGAAASVPNQTGLAGPLTGIAATPDGGGYWATTASGQVLNEGDAANFGSVTTPLRAPIVGISGTPSGNGYWLVASDGGVFTFGDARFFGSTGAMVLNEPVVGMASTSDGNGYWLVASDGGVFTFGDAPFLGSTGAMVLNEPVVGMAST
jgi:hypothetical protein